MALTKDRLELLVAHSTDIIIGTNRDGNVDYYNDERVHTSIGDAPNGRAVESRPSEHAKVVGLPRVGGIVPENA